MKSRQLSFYIIFLVIIILSFFLFNSAYSQEIVDKKHAFTLKKNIHNISYEPINGFGYSYSRKIKSKNYFDVGTQISAGTNLDDMENSYLFYGVYSSFFYGFKHLKIGHGLQIGIIKGNQYKYSGFVLTLSPIILQYTFTH